MTKSRAYTKEEIEDKIYAHVAMLAKYWATESSENDPIEKCMGMAHSIFSMLAGCSYSIPAFSLIPNPHPDDQEFHKNLGENWYPKNIHCDLDGYSFYRSLERQSISYTSQKGN